MTDLAERYVLAVLRHVPESRRGDLERELRGTIADLVETRTSAGMTDAGALRSALMELGDPDRYLAAAEGRPDHLIGPEVYFAWRRLLVRLLAVVLPVVVAVTIAVRALTGADVGEVASAAVLVAMSTALHIGFWTTLVFAVLERSGSRSAVTRTGRWRPEQLPESSDGQVRAPELAAQLVAFALVGVAAVWQHVASPVVVGGERVPLLDPAGWAAWWPVALAVLVGEAVFAVHVSRRGWTRAAAAWNVALASALVVPTVAFATAGTLFDARFFAALGPAADAGVVGTATVACVVVVVLGGVWDVVDGVLRARRAERRAAGAVAPRRSSETV